MFTKNKWFHADWTEQLKFSFQSQGKLHENLIHTFQRRTLRLYSGGNKWNQGSEKVHLLRMDG